MGLFDFFVTEEQQKCLYFRDDFKAVLMTLPIRRKLIVLEKDNKPAQCWPFDPRLLTRLVLNGHDHGIVYPIANRNAVFDPHNVTGDDFKGKKLWEKLQAIAAEEFHFARDKKVKDLTERAVYPLAIAAGIIVVIAGLLTAYNMYQ